MFYIPVIKSQKRSKKSTLIEKCEIVERNCSLTRKVLRFGMEIPIIIGMIKRKKGEKLLLLKTLADIFDMTYLMMDHPQYFHNTGFAKLYENNFRK